MKLIKSRIDLYKGTILYIKGYSLYNVLNVVSDQIAKGFSNKGYNVCLVDFSDDNDLNSLGEYLFNEYVFVFSMQAIHFDAYIDGKNMIEYIKVPSVGWIFDDVLFHYQKIKALSYDNTYLFSIDSKSKEHVSGLEYCNGKLLFMPHGAIEGESESEKYIKSIDILFPGSMSGYPDSKDYFNDSVSTYVAEKSIEILKIMPGISVREAIKRTLIELGQEYTHVLQDAFKNVINYVSLYFREFCREKVLHDLAETGCEIHVLGENNIGREYPENVIFHGAVDINETIEMMKKSKVLINAIPNVYEGGLHERILTGMLCDCIVYTLYTDYLKDNLDSKVEYIFLNDEAAFKKNVVRSINEYDSYKNYENNRKYAMNNSFKKRGEQIIEILEKIL